MDITRLRTSMIIPSIEGDADLHFIWDYSEETIVVRIEDHNGELAIEVDLEFFQAVISDIQTAWFERNKIFEPAIDHFAGGDHDG